MISGNVESGKQAEKRGRRTRPFGREREGQREEERESTVGKARKERRNVTQGNIAQME